jgi:copper chaperone NosL
MKKFAKYLTFGWLLFLAACGGTTVTPGTPPAIVYGEDVCDHCGMIISDERFAAAIVLQTGAQRYAYRIFDDIGDMLAFVQSANQEEGDTSEIVSYFVHDYVDHKWLNAQEAHFVQTATLPTPMGSGVVAFADHADAERHAQEWHTIVHDFAGVLEVSTAEHSHEHP